MLGANNKHNFKVVVNPSQTPVLENTAKLSQTLSPFSRLMTGASLGDHARFRSRQTYYSNLLPQPEVKEVARETSVDSLLHPTESMRRPPLESQRRLVKRQKSQELTHPSQTELIDNNSSPSQELFFFDPRNAYQALENTDYVPPSSSQRPNRRRSTIMSRMMPVTQVSIKKSEQRQETAPMLRRRKGSAVFQQSRNSNVTSRVSQMYPHVMPSFNGENIKSEGF